MSEVSNSKRQCVTCGKLYKVCFTCESYKAQGHEFWRATACSPECYQVHLVLSDFYYNKMSQEEAKGHLDRLLSDEMLPYTDNSRGLIQQIIQSNDSLHEEIAIDDAINLEQNECVDAHIDIQFVQDDVLYYPDISNEDVDEIFQEEDQEQI